MLTSVSPSYKAGCDCLFFFFKRIKIKCIYCISDLFQFYCSKKSIQCHQVLCLCHPCSRLLEVKFHFLGCGKFPPIHHLCFFLTKSYYCYILLISHVFVNLDPNTNCCYFSWMIEKWGRGSGCAGQFPLM